MQKIVVSSPALNVSHVQYAYVRTLLYDRTI